MNDFANWQIFRGIGIFLFFLGLILYFYDRKFLKKNNIVPIGIFLVILGWILCILSLGMFILHLVSKL